MHWPSVFDTFDVSGVNSPPKIYGCGTKSLTFYVRNTPETMGNIQCNACIKNIANSHTATFGILKQATFNIFIFITTPVVSQSFLCNVFSCHSVVKQPSILSTVVFWVVTSCSFTDGYQSFGDVHKVYTATRPTGQYRLSLRFNERNVARNLQNSIPLNIFNIFFPQQLRSLYHVTFTTRVAQGIVAMFYSRVNTR